MTPHPELAALIRRLTIGVEAFNASPEDGPSPITEATDKIWRAIVAFEPCGIADVLAKSRAAEIYGDEPIGENAEHPMSADRALALMRADLERLLTKGPSPGSDRSDRP